MEFPKDLRYTKDHEWAKIEDNTIVIGVTAFAVEQLGDITLVDLAEVGEEISTGDTCGTIESVKSVSDIFTPVGGKVVRVNERLEDEPELVNDAPYGDGWMLAIEVDGAEFDELLSAQAYTELVAKES